MQKGTRRKRSAYRKDHTSLEGAGFEVNTTLNRQNGQALQFIFLIIPADMTKITQQAPKDLMYEVFRNYEGWRRGSSSNGIKLESV
jgi:hypothetical protein